MKLTTMLAVAALLCAPIMTQSAYAATDANEPSATETTKPPAKHKSMKHHKHHAKQQGKHYGRNVHHPAKHKAS
ncbi:hypothetical protein [Methylocystis sp. B8]|uniref:hypothetical protein n=1 Tax=Methylocystis sp. B8 TaxID=544938 RepID=UPI0010FD0B6D|nr:hypothetical protein [Methylocystis sp. B8]TLG77694.1 hypothetical protein FEV16_07655 [Methylocystis sp. B8]